MAASVGLAVADFGDDESPLRTLVLGPDRSGNILEVIVLHFDDGREMVIHAMPMRSHDRGLLPRPPKTPTKAHMKTSPIVGTSRGKPITEADIDRMAAETEPRYDVTALRPRGGRPSMGSRRAEVVPVRLDPEPHAAVEVRATADDTTTSEIIREALRRCVHVA